MPYDYTDFKTFSGFVGVNLPLTALAVILIPPVLSACLWHKLNHKSFEAKFWLASYGISMLGIHFLCTAFLALAFGYSDSVVRLLNIDFPFALKYLMLAGGFALITPPALFVMIRKGKFNQLSEKSRSFDHWHGVLCLLAFVLLGLTISMALGNTFWCDEIFTINMLNSTPREIIYNTASDVHPPLYYLCGWFLVQLFGASPLVYRLASLVPFYAGVCTHLNLPRFGKRSCCDFNCVCVTAKHSCAI